MRLRQRQLAPSSSLPPLNTLGQLMLKDVFSTLQELSTIYCPFPVSLAFRLNPEARETPNGASRENADSGYTSGTDGIVEERVAQGFRDPNKRDLFERKCAESWLMGFLARADNLRCLASEEAKNLAIDLASCILQALLSPAGRGPQELEHHDFSRHFSFPLGSETLDAGTESIEIQLNDGLAGTNPTDPSDVGLQSWGASVIFSKLLCSTPGFFLPPQPKAQPVHVPLHIIELGAGTGLVSLVLGALLPSLGVIDSTVVATDYHPQVLKNLKANIEGNPASFKATRIKACSLDWSRPKLRPPLDIPADILVATDVVYAPEHAQWLRDCASLLLGPEGVFWLLVTVRSNGRFEGTSQAVEVAFANKQPGRERQLAILSVDKIEKQKGVGRGDESGYKLYRIGWEKSNNRRP